MPGNEGPSSQRRTKTAEKLTPYKPKKVKSPILEKSGDPGGPMTPGAKKKRKKSGY